jgi:hypothetical protein
MIGIMRTKPNSHPQSPPPQTADKRPPAPSSNGPAPKEPAKEIGGPKGPEPTRYGDWEVNGRCSDF